MVIEHEFVTTLDRNAALSSAARFLSEGGFSSDGNAFAVGQTEWESLEVKRGKKSAARAKNISELPQRIIVNYDRGRVTVAASITASHAWGGSSSFSIGIGSDAPAESQKKMVLHQQLLIAIANGLECALTPGHDDLIAHSHWRAAEQAITQAARKRKRTALIVGGLVILGFAILIAVVAIMVSR